MTWFAIGDYGFKDIEKSRQIADKMEAIASQEKVDFIIGTGDNFFDTAEIHNFGLGMWDLKRMKNHKEHPGIKNLMWYNVVGNHAYNCRFYETVFHEPRPKFFRIDDYYWCHSMKTPDGKSIAFFHIDTNFFAYGGPGEDENQNMNFYFYKY